MHILVKGTTVIAWGSSPITPGASDEVPFEVGDFPGTPERGSVLHWDGIRWWTEPDIAKPEEAAAIVLSALPAASLAISDADAVRLAPYIPAIDPSADYPEGALATRYGKVVRKTSIGWREIG